MTDAIFCPSMMAGNSVTRFGEVSPLWHDFRKLWSFWKGSFGIWQNFELTLVNFICCWAKFHCCKWPKIEQTIYPPGHTGFNVDYSKFFLLLMLLMYTCHLAFLATINSRNMSVSFSSWPSVWDETNVQEVMSSNPSTGYWTDISSNYIVVKIAMLVWKDQNRYMQEQAADGSYKNF